MFEGCSCDEESCEKLQKNYFDIPPENLKLSPLNFNDLAEASKTVAPSATVKDVEKINYFYKHKQLPGDHDQNSGFVSSVPRPPAHGIAEWLIGLSFVGFLVFCLVLFYKMSM